jgi:hypothetical protein
MNRSGISEPATGRPTDPSKVLAREDLTFEDKVALLKHWQLDLTDRMTAADENMTGTQEEGQLAEQHRHVSEALGILEQEVRGH